MQSNGENNNNKVTRRERPTTDWVCASSTLFGIEIAEATQAICKLIPGGKALSRQLLLASSTDKALLMPRLLPVSHTSCSDSLFYGKQGRKVFFLRMADFHLHLVKRKVDEVFVGRRRERRRSGSKIIILSGVNLEKSMQVIHYNFLIYTKEPYTESIFWILCNFSLNYPLYF